jgi:hypothetical protein
MLKDQQSMREGASNISLLCLMKNKNHLKIIFRFLTCHLPISIHKLIAPNNSEAIYQSLRLHFHAFRIHHPQQPCYQLMQYFRLIQIKAFNSNRTKLSIKNLQANWIIDRLSLVYLSALIIKVEHLLLKFSNQQITKQ